QTTTGSSGAIDLPQMSQQNRLHPRGLAYFSYSGPMVKSPFSVVEFDDRGFIFDVALLNHQFVDGVDGLIIDVVAVTALAEEGFQLSLAVVQDSLGSVIFDGLIELVRPVSVAGPAPVGLAEF